jgi:hypothetical protein
VINTVGWLPQKIYMAGFACRKQNRGYKTSLKKWSEKVMGRNRSRGGRVG